jgi:hypothetical protein
MAADGEPDQAVELSQSEEEELRAGTERALHQHRFGSAWSRYFDVKADLEARRAARLSEKLVAARARREAEAAKQPAQLQDRRLQAQVLDYERQLQREARPPEPVIDEPAIDGRLERWRIPLLSFWWILEQRVKRGELAEVKSLLSTRGDRRGWSSSAARGSGTSSGGSMGIRMRRGARSSWTRSPLRSVPTSGVCSSRSCERSRSLTLPRGGSRKAARNVAVVPRTR